LINLKTGGEGDLSNKISPIQREGLNSYPKLRAWCVSGTLVSDAGNAYSRLRSKSLIPAYEAANNETSAKNFVLFVSSW
jgi:hypothetical protein